ncbi:unnamed protein product [Parnassius apollo]|uniref:(apollo) hypothetical protein n=1 Tax=Parnassius apollo TaxID=110799 RepID=A0A8S3W378_PARAO|nr:unnamed protein product [Parnassius apollo]
MLNENTEEKIETDEEIETYILHEETWQIVKKNPKKSRVSLVSSAVTQNDSPSTSTENDSRNELVVPLSLSYVPNSLKAICIDMINNYIHSLVQDIGSESPDLCIFGENLRSCEENLSFIAHDEKDLSVCLQTQNLLWKISPSGVKLTANSSPKN